MNRFFLVPALGAAALALSTQAQARQIGSVVESARPSYSDEARQPYYESRRAAYDNGYREGLKEGERDGRNRSVRRYEDNRTWQRGDKGYNRSFGDVERYRQQFRVGFTEGYQAGYARYGQVAGRYESGRAIPRPGPSGYPGGYGNSYPDRNRYPAAGYGYGGYGYSVGYSNGLNDGVEKGREDARKHRSFDPLRHEWYREGDRHYKNDYGSRQQYANVYRDGFKEGYERGYRELGYYR